MTTRKPLLDSPPASETRARPERRAESHPGRTSQCRTKEKKYHIFVDFLPTPIFRLLGVREQKSVTNPCAVSRPPRPRQDTPTLLTSYLSSSTAQSRVPGVTQRSAETNVICCLVLIFLLFVRHATFLFMFTDVLTSEELQKVIAQPFSLSSHLHVSLNFACRRHLLDRVDRIDSASSFSCQHHAPLRVMKQGAAALCPLERPNS